LPRQGGKAERKVSKPIKENVKQIRSRKEGRTVNHQGGKKEQKGNGEIYLVKKKKGKEGVLYVGEPLDPLRAKKKKGVTARPLG